MPRDFYYHDPKVLDYDAIVADAVKHLPTVTTIHFHKYGERCDGYEHKKFPED